MALKGRLISPFSLGVSACLLASALPNFAYAQERLQPLPAPAPTLPTRSSTYLPSFPLDSLGPSGGYRVGRWALLPSVSTSLAYDDNINADKNNREDDFIWSVNGAIRAQSLWRRHSLGFFASAGTGQYFKNSSESEVNWLVGSDGTLNLTRSSSLSGSVTYTRDTEDPEDPDSEGNADDNVFHQINTSASYNRDFGTRIGWSLTGGFSRTEFENSDSSDRDRSTYRISTSPSYRVNDDLSVNLTPSYSRTEYDSTDNDDGSDQGSQSVTLTAGASYAVGPRLSASGNVGYSWFLPEDNNDDDTTGIVFSGSLGYVIDGRTSTSFAVNRSINDTDVDGASARINTSASASLTRALRRGMTLTFSAGGNRGEFEGIDRTDHRIFGAVRYGYALTSATSFTASYRYSQGFSDDNENEFYRNIFLIGLSMAL